MMSICLPAPSVVSAVPEDEFPQAVSATAIITAAMIDMIFLMFYPPAIL